MLTEVGAVLEGRVTGITKFGAFVALPDGKSGLVHISEIANTYVTDVNEHVQVGQTVKVKVLSIGDEGKVSLSMKRAEENPRPRPQPMPRPAQDPRPQGERLPYRGGRSGYGAEKLNAAADPSFEDRLKQFMQDTDSKNSGNRLYEKKSVNRRKK